MNQAPLRYVIIGNGIAGISAAQEIRQTDPQGVITLIGDEGERYYYRAALSEWLTKINSDAMLPGRTPEFYQHMRIKEITGHVTKVDPQLKTLSFADKKRPLPYDRLLIASGARAHSVSIAGQKEVQVYRTLAHARLLQEKLDNCDRVLVLGGGVLGLELAGALVMMEIKKVAIVQTLDFIGGPLLDKATSEWLQERLLKDGIELYLNDTVTSVEGSSAQLRSGEIWDFDLLVQSVGVRPTYPEVPNLETGCGIRINAAGHTNLHDIYAAGDCTETCSPTTGNWSTTRIWRDGAQQGRIAGQNMTGHYTTLSQHIPYNASVIYDVPYSYIGTPHGEEGRVYLWVPGKSTNKTYSYRKIRVVDGKLAGALLLGDRRGSMAIHQSIGLDVAQYGPEIAKPDFPWNDSNGETWDYHPY